MNTRILINNWKKVVEHEGEGITIVVGALKTIVKGLEKRLGEMGMRKIIETIQTASQLMTWRNLLSHRIQWKSIS